MKLLATDPGKNKMVLCGEVVGDTLFRWVKPEHFMRIMQAYGIQEIAFQKIYLDGVRKIVLKEEGTGKNWEATTMDWRVNGRVADYGHGKQRFLSMKFMKNHRTPTEDPVKEAIRAQSIQDALF